jgi:hypothetical protein
MSQLEERGLLFVFRERFPLMGFVSLATSVSSVDDFVRGRGGIRFSRRTIGFSNSSHSLC